MASLASGTSSEFRDYPFLTAEEFTEICHHLDRRYRQATLGPLRRRWQLNVCTALDTSFASEAEYTTYVQIIRPLDGELDDSDLSTCLNAFSLDPEPALGLDRAADEKMEIDEADEVSASCLPDNLGDVSRRHRR